MCVAGEALIIDMDLSIASFDAISEVNMVSPPDPRPARTCQTGLDGNGLHILLRLSIVYLAVL